MYRDRVVAVHADIPLALPHGALLVDKDRPKKGLRLGVDLPEADSSAINPVPSILNDCSVESPLDRALSRLFIGKLAYSTKGHVDLRLLAVSRVQIQPCPCPETLSPTPCAGKSQRNSSKRGPDLFTCPPRIQTPAALAKPALGLLITRSRILYQHEKNQSHWRRPSRP